MGRPPSHDKDRIIVRLPDGMRERIKAAADASGRTMTAEIVWRLEKSLSGVEAQLDKHSREISDVSDLAYDTHEHGWAMDGRMMMLEGFAIRVAAKLGIEPPTEHDLKAARRTKSPKP